MKKVRLQDIADQMGISVVTVSNAISGRDGVSDQLRADILKMAEKMGYKSQKKKHTGSETRGKQIGVIIPEKFLAVEKSFYWDLYQALVCEIAKYHNYTVLELMSTESLEKKELPGLILDGQADAVIIMGNTGTSNARQIEKNCNKPLLFIDYFDETLKSDFVLFNNYMGMYEVAKYVIDMGHREIAYVGNIYATDSIFDRYMGTLRAMMQKEIDLKNEWIISDRNAITGEVKLELPDKLPTAFICNSDYTAKILKDELTERGMKIPDDISVTGFDNFMSGDRFLEKLTTYDVNIRATASEAAHLIHRRLNGKPISNKEPRKIVHVEGKLVVRNSVKDLTQ